MLGVPRRRIAFECDSLPHGERHWGQGGDWSVTVAPGATLVRAQIESQGDQITGRIQLSQHHLQLTVVPATTGEPTVLWQQLAHAGQGIDQLQLSATLSGSSGAIDWEIESNLGSELQERFQTAAQQLIHEQTEQLVSAAREQLQTQLDHWQQQLPVPGSELKQQLAATDQLLSTLSQPLLSRLQPLGQLWRRF